MKFHSIYILTILGLFAFTDAHPKPNNDDRDHPQRIKRQSANDKWYRVVYYSGGVAGELLDTVFLPFKAPVAIHDPSGLEHTALMTYEQARDIYDQTTRAAGIWNTGSMKYVKYWQPWYYLEDNKPVFEKYARKHAL